MKRRTAIAALSASGLFGKDRAPRILVRSGWQWENIGDIAHTPGLLALIEKNIPDAQVTLFSTGLAGGAREMLQKRFPRLSVIESLELTPGGPLEKAFDEADMLIHGSAAGVQRQHLDLWRQRSKKPYGLFGVTVSVTNEAASAKLDDAIKATLNDAAFVFTRETQSLANVRGAGITAKQTDFVPDGTFSVDLSDEATASAFLTKSGLAGKPFIALVPRLRYTPYHEFRKTGLPGPEEIKRRVAVNDRYKEDDAEKLREVATAWVRKTGGHVLLCAEMTYQLGMLDPLLFDPLPGDVKPKVVVRKEYWLPNEAISIYRQARGVVSCECHSPIMALTNGTPAFYIRQPEDTIKGQMYTDLGVGEWAPHIEQISSSALAELVLTTIGKGDVSRKHALGAASKAQSIQTTAIMRVAKMIV